MPFGKGGVLGNRAVKINDLIVKMLWTCSKRQLIFD
jgi:hypothetical protein